MDFIENEEYETQHNGIIAAIGMSINHNETAITSQNAGLYSNTPNGNDGKPHLLREEQKEHYTKNTSMLQPTWKKSRL